MHVLWCRNCNFNSKIVVYLKCIRCFAWAQTIRYDLKLAWTANASIHWKHVIIILHSHCSPANLLFLRLSQQYSSGFKFYSLALSILLFFFRFVSFVIYYCLIHSGFIVADLNFCEQQIAFDLLSGVCTWVWGKICTFCRRTRFKVRLKSCIKFLPEFHATPTSLMHIVLYEWIFRLCTRKSKNGFKNTISAEHKNILHFFVCSFSNCKKFIVCSFRCTYWKNSARFFKWKAGHKYSRV